MSSNEEWAAHFSRADGWSLRLSSELRDYPAFSLRVSRTSLPQQGFEIWLLMEVFRGKIRWGRRRGSFDNQIWFLKRFADKIFDESVPYRAEYDRANQPPAWLRDIAEKRA